MTSDTEVNGTDSVATVPVVRRAKIKAKAKVKAKVAAKPAPKAKLAAKAKAKPRTKSKPAVKAKTKGKAVVKGKTKGKAKSRPVATAHREGSIIENGIVRPGDKTSCGKVWKIADQISAKTRKPAEHAKVIERAIAQGVNAATAKTQYGRWRQFNGVTRAT